MQDQAKTNFDEAKHRAAAGWDAAKDKAQFAKDQTSDKVNENYYAAKQEVRQGAQDLKDTLRGEGSSDQNKDKKSWF